MDISIVDKNCLKVRGKKASFVFDPKSGMSKTNADAILLSNHSDADISRVTDSRVVIDGPGEYEVSGSKISSVRASDGLIYKLSIDGISIIVGKSVDFSKLESNFTTCEVVVLEADDNFNESWITSLNSKIILLYGDKKEESAKKLGAENLKSSDKFSIAKDKLPEKTEIIILG